MSIACVKTYPLSNGHGWIGTGAVHWVPEVLPSLRNCSGPPLEQHWPSLWNSTRPPLKLHWTLSLEQHCPPALEQHHGLTTSEYEEYEV